MWRILIPQAWGFSKFGVLGGKARSVAPWRLLALNQYITFFFEPADSLLILDSILGVHKVDIIFHRERAVPRGRPLRCLPFWGLGCLKPQ